GTGPNLHAVHRFIASGFYAGLIPQRLWGSDNGAGTFGAAVGVIISLLLWRYPWWIGAIAFAIAFGLSLWSAAPFADDHADPGWIVMDEVAGTLVAVIGLTGWPWLVAVVVARLADIFKVLPGVPQAEALPGAIGITMDDVIAGLYGMAAGWLVWWLM
ncbi:MAG: phosphatidylglycerophosphatase A, partial [Actinomycetota bacterium]|nr:phosphatidylglycerophosphatase A [Actinomycetota bacterium]